MRRYSFRDEKSLAKRAEATILREEREASVSLKILLGLQIEKIYNQKQLIALWFEVFKSLLILAENISETDYFLTTLTEDGYRKWSEKYKEPHLRLIDFRDSFRKFDDENIPRIFIQVAPGCMLYIREDGRLDQFAAEQRGYENIGDRAYLRYFDKIVVTLRSIQSMKVSDIKKDLAVIREWIKELQKKEVEV